MSSGFPPPEQAIPKDLLTEEQVAAADASRGATVHVFDPDASPEEKAAAAGKALHLDGPHGYHGKGEGQKTGGAKAVKLDSSASPGPAPTVTINDIDKTSKLEGQGKNGEAVAIPVAPKAETVGADGVPGAIKEPPADGIPDWYRVGWRAVSGIDGVPGDGSVAAERTVLAEFMSEQAYGTWWQNAGVIFFAVSASHFFAVLRLGIGWTIILLAVCSTYYTTSITRVRRAARDDIQRELVKTRLVSEHESADWINNFLNRFWKIYEPVLSATIVASVDQVLSTSTPAFLESIKMTTFTLGTKAPSIDSVRTFPKTADDVVIMDWKLSFTPTDLSDVTPREQQFQTNPKIVLEVKIGKGFISAPMPILLEDMSFTGNMRIKLKLMNNFPHVQLVEMSFLEKPYFDYVLKPLGGDAFGVDIASIPGLSGFIRDMVHANLGPMMYDPAVFTLNLEQLLSGAPLDTAIGVLEIKLDSARGIKSTKLGGGAPDPYVSVAIAGKQEVARTEAKSSTYNPQWSETEYIIISSLSDVLALTVMDFNDHRKDTELGIANFELTSLQADAEQEDLKLPILKAGKTMGELRTTINFYPVLVPKKLADGTLDAVPETRSGICRLTIHQAKDLDASRLLGVGGGGVNPYAKLYIGGQREPAHKTGVFKNNFQPSWESSYEFLVPDKDSSNVTLRVVDDRDFVKDPTLGYVTVSLNDLLTAKERQQDWFPLARAKTGRVRLSAEWKPLDLPGSVNGAGAYTAPIGILRILLKKAVDVKNVEALLGGKSDPYVRVLSHGNVLARTEVINNNLNPAWDQYVYVPVHSLSDRPILEVMDYQHLTKDRSLGSVELHVNELAKASEDKRTPFASLGVQIKQDGIRIDGKNATKGTLFYDVEFCPAVNLKGGVSFESKEAGALSADGNAVSPIAPTAPVDGEEVTANQDEVSGVELSSEELLASPSALLVIQAISGSMEKRGRLEVLLDDGYWPSFSTPKARGHHTTWDQVGEAFVKELPLSRVCLRLNENDEDEKEDIFAELRMDTRLLVQQCLDAPKDFTLNATDGSGRKSTVKLCARLVPVDIVLQPRESANNAGVLHVEVVDGGELRAADRSGKSDPYAVLTLNGEKVFKTKEVRKTLAPAWNESFDVNIPSRVGADFQVEVFDFNKIEQAKTLGLGSINLADLEPFEAQEAKISLISKEGAKGWVRVRLNFQPAIIARSRKNTSTFSTAGRAMTQIGHAPIGIAGAAGKGAFKGVGMVGHGVGSVGGFAGRKIGLVKKKDKSGKEVLVEEEIDDGLSGAADPTVTSTDFALAGPQGIPQDGSLTVTVLSARDLAEEAKVEVAVTAGSKTHKTKHSAKSTTPEWNDDLHFSLTTEVKSLSVHLYEHHTLGKDKTIGTGEVDLWRSISAAVPTADVEVPIREGGVLRLKLAFRPQGGASASPSVPQSPVVAGGGGSQINNLTNGSRTSLAMASPAKSSRKSISGDSPSTSRLFGRKKDRE